MSEKKSATEIDKKVPPNVEESEAFVIGSMLIDGDSQEKAFERLRPEDFYTKIYELIFKAMTKLSEKNITIDLMSVANTLKKAGQLPDVVGGNDLTYAIEMISTPLHVDHHISLIKDASILRKLLTGSHRITQKCLAADAESREVLESAEKMIYEISDMGMGTGLEKADAAVHEAMEIIERVHLKKSHITGMPTGFIELDRITSGFQPGNMITLGARPSMGKTSLALDIVRHTLLKEKKPVAFFSLEMSKTEVINRITSCISGVELKRLQTGQFKQEKWKEIMKAAEAIGDSQFYIDCSASNSTSINIRSSCRRLASQVRRAGSELSLIVVDYIQLISTSSKTESRQMQVSEISRSIKAMAMDLKVPVLVLSQLNRQTEEQGRSGRPRLSDIRESGSIEQDSDIVMFIYREALYKKGSSPEDQAKTKLIIAKHRNGACGEVDLYFRWWITSFIDLEKKVANSPEDFPRSSDEN